MKRNEWTINKFTENKKMAKDYSKVVGNISIKLNSQHVILRANRDFVESDEIINLLRNDTIIL